MTKSVGVVIARFQTPTLTKPHQDLLELARHQHPYVLVLLGVARTPPSARNPMDFLTRAEMVRDFDPNFFILPLKDCRTDEEWSEQIDGILSATFPGTPATLYGSRDSFIPHYKGKHSTENVRLIYTGCASDLREDIRAKPRTSEDFRAGVIYASNGELARVSPTVDIAVMRTTDNKAVPLKVPQVLLGSKTGDRGLWRFPGGFVDVTDKSVEDAARRELFEETKLSIEGPLHYLGSHKVDDWRLRSPDLGIMTSFFWGMYCFGPADPHDDLDYLEWFYLTEELKDRMVPEHVPLLSMLYTHFKGSNS